MLYFWYWKNVSYNPIGVIYITTWQMERETHSCTQYAARANWYTWYNTKANWRETLLIISLVCGEITHKISSKERKCHSLATTYEVLSIYVFTPKDLVNQCPRACPCFAKPKVSMILCVCVYDYVFTCYLYISFNLEKKFCLKFSCELRLNMETLITVTGVFIFTAVNLCLSSFCKLSFPHIFQRFTCSFTHSKQDQSTIIFCLFSVDAWTLFPACRWTLVQSEKNTFKTYIFLFSKCCQHTDSRHW